MDKITLTRSNFINFMILHESPYITSPSDIEVWEQHWGVKYDLLAIYTQSHNPTLSKRIKNIVTKFIFLFTSKR